jgi:hypothetical protein
VRARRGSVSRSALGSHRTPLAIVTGRMGHAVGSAVARLARRELDSADGAPFGSWSLDWQRWPARSAMRMHEKALVQFDGHAPPGRQAPPAARLRSSF